LGRSLRWTAEGLGLKADKKHVNRLKEFFDFDNATKGSVVPGSKEDQEEAEKNGIEELVGSEIKDYRGMAATANYLSLDQPNIHYAAKGLCRDMSRPTKASVRALKKLVRYLVVHPVVEIRFAMQNEPNELKCYVDSDWAGCLKTRRSTSGGALCCGPHCIKTWSSTQGTCALSSGEAELYAIVEGCARALAIQSLVEDLGWSKKLRVFTDSSAGKSIVSRQGIGKIRHLETKYLWVQQVVFQKRLEICKIPGKLNPADVMTKYLSFAESDGVLRDIGVFVERKINGTASSTV
jgi:hypothetical protein